MRRLLLALCAPLFLAACDDCDDCDGSGNPVPIFTESERNDSPATADHFGVLLPGDRFFIEGFIQDGGFDPFDGFAFTAGQPLHVDFQLFIDDPLDDLDVCLYDPQLDLTLACFATANNPEQGGVDVDIGGLDFQLVVESFLGDSNYALEIDVQPFTCFTNALTAARGVAAATYRGSAAGDVAALTAEPQDGHDPDAPRDYRVERREARPILEIEQHVLLDELGRPELMIVRVR